MLGDQEESKATHRRDDTVPAPPDPAVMRAAIAAPPVDNGETPQAQVLARMRANMAAGRDAVRARFMADGDPEDVIRTLSTQMDALLTGALNFADTHLYPLANPTSGEAFALIAVGGYGRAELAPGSDIDLLFVYPYKMTPHLEQMAEFLLYRLWDLGLKVGQATRSLDECIKLAGSDLTVLTSMLEARFIWGSRPLFDELVDRFRKECVAGREPEFIEAKLAERDARHQRVGDTRYLLEPNVKEGKGGLRDLHTLFWIGRFIYRMDSVRELVKQGVLTPQALRTFMRAQRFLWAVRCHLHYLTDRPEERLTFDMQTEVAAAMGFRDRERSRGVERFMKRYYLVAKDVGSLTRIFCAALEEQHKRRPRFSLPRFGLGKRHVDGFVIQGNRIALADPDLFERQPVRMLDLFRIADERQVDIHPMALAAITQNLRRVDAAMREDPDANRSFRAMLASPRDPAMALLRMHEAGLLGRFVPEFGRIVAQMQHNLYHVYTVDEHTIRAIAELARIERGELEDELPLATSIMPNLLSREELYIATFLHDIGKGRGGDHSNVGARIARKVCPRLGLSDDSTETVEWLVRHHLVMSAFAFKRDTEDPKTVQDFVDIVQSPERLRLLLALTVADIRAVGPTVWNGWKGQLLRELYHEAETVMASGDASGRRQARAEQARQALAAALADAKDGPGWPKEMIDAYIQRHDPRYWLGVHGPAQVRHALLVQRAESTGSALAVDFHVDSFRARTELALYTPDHPGLFMKVAGALALNNVTIVDAHIFTTRDGMALDTLGCQTAEGGGAVEDEARLERIRETIEKAMGGEIWLEEELAKRRPPRRRTDIFKVEPRVLINNQASATHSVLELNGRDRPGLLFAIARGLKELGVAIHSAHVSTYGERVVDVFYVKDVFGMKITHPGKIRRVRARLGEILADA